MSTFVSLMDIVNENAPVTPIKEELASMKAEVKSHMDSGLTSDEMKTAKAYYDAIIIAEDALEQIANK